jgi:DNA-binding beta-propeller fold protein YncE
MNSNSRTKFWLLALAVAVVLGSSIMSTKLRAEAAALMVPSFEVDPLWPKPLPNHWVLGMTIGVSTDAHDNVWIIHRNDSPEPKEVYETWKPPAADCCMTAPPVLEFNQAGDLIGHWGGPGTGYEWPSSLHGITVDYQGNIWIGGNGKGTEKGHFLDSQILKFTPEGKFLLQIGHSNQSKGSNDTENVAGAAKMFVDPKTDELYVADGYGNRRVIVFNAATGALKRYWGAYGNKPDDTDLGNYDSAAPVAQQFRMPVHCAVLSNDDLVYVCDRKNDRIQVFKTDGTFVKEMIIKKDTRGDGSVWDIAFSRDPEQKFLYLADGANEEVHILLRSTLEILTSFGDGGRQPGQFYAVHSITTDSKGNLYTTETYRGQRVQRFIYKGLVPVTQEHQGVLWPKK